MTFIFFLVFYSVLLVFYGDLLWFMVIYCDLWWFINALLATFCSYRWGITMVEIVHGHRKACPKLRNTNVQIIFSSLLCNPKVRFCNHWTNVNPRNTGWWFGTFLIYFSLQLGMSSSQFTNSYFSEGLKPQAPTRYIHIAITMGNHHFQWVNPLFGPWLPVRYVTNGLVSSEKKHATHEANLPWLIMVNNG